MSYTTANPPIDECLRLCRLLQDCLQTERKALVELQLEALIENNALKESLISQLMQEIRTNRLSKLKEKNSDWESIVNDTRALCRENQKLLAHCSKNMAILSENIKSLYSCRLGYSAAGQSLESSAEGRLLQGSI